MTRPYCQHFDARMFLFGHTHTLDRSVHPCTATRTSANRRCLTHAITLTSPPHVSIQHSNVETFCVLYNLRPHNVVPPLLYPSLVLKSPSNDESKKLFHAAPKLHREVQMPRLVRSVLLETALKRYSSAPAPPRPLRLVEAAVILARLTTPPPSASTPHHNAFSVGWRRRCARAATHE